MRKKAIPKYRRQTHKSGGLAFVMLDGRHYYLGKYGAPESKEQYLRLLKWPRERLLICLPGKKMVKYSIDLLGRN